MFKEKQQDKTPEEELSKEEICSLPDKKFKVMIIKVFKEIRRRLDEQSEKLEFFNKELEQTEMK